MLFARTFTLSGLLVCLVLMTACSKIFSPLKPQSGAPNPSPTLTSLTTPILTATFTATPTATSTTSPTPQFTPTASPTGCSAAQFSFNPPAQTTVSAGTTVAFTGSFGTSKGGYACQQSYQISSITFHVSPSWTVPNQITHMFLYQNGTLVGDAVPSGGDATFSGSPILQSSSGSAGNFTVDCVLASTTPSGLFFLQINQVAGSGSAGFFWTQQGAFPQSAMVTVSP